MQSTLKNFPGLKLATDMFALWIVRVVSDIVLVNSYKRNLRAIWEIKTLSAVIGFYHAKKAWNRSLFYKAILSKIGYL